MANASSTDPRAPNAPSRAAGAFGETLLATEQGPMRATSSDLSRASVVQASGARPDDAAPQRTLAERLRAIPVAIQGVWVGLACIVLLVASAAAIRSLFSVAVGPVRGGSVATSATAVAPPSAPVIASAPPTTIAPAASSPGSVSIGGAPGNAGMAGFGALSIRDRLPGHIRLRKIGPFMDDLERLLAIEPTAIDRADVRKMIGDAATYGLVAAPNGAISPDGERVFTFLTTRAGTAGPDILFDLVSTRGGTRASSYAEELLKRPDIRAKGTPALRIACDLRFAASCQDGQALFDRVKADGDRRVLGTLFTMARCGRGPTDCCIANDPGYRDVVRVITSKK